MKMKLLVLSTLLATSSILAQQFPVQKGNDIRAMQRSLTLLRDPLSPSDAKPIKLDLRYTATTIRRDGSVVKLSGNVKVLKPDAFLLLADEVEYHEDTGELIPTGRVSIQLIPPPEKK
jgi:lipopolysaccharide assembly outer membrane protein LptD (OstA)